MEVTQRDVPPGGESRHDRPKRVEALKKMYDELEEPDFFPLDEITATSDAMDSKHEYHLVDCNGDLIKILDPEGETFQYYPGMRLKIVDKSGLPPGAIRIDT